MAKMPSTTIICNADAISRGATAALARGPSPSKNALLNAMAAAIAGPGHDWGFVKNAPAGRLVQPGLETAAPTPAPAAPPASVWTVLYDEREDWARAPMVFASKEAALAHVAGDSWWTHVDHPREKVLAALADGGEYVFREDDEDGASLDEDEPYSITISEVPVEGRPAPAMDGAPGDAHGPEDSGALSPLLVHEDGGQGGSSRSDQGMHAIYMNATHLAEQVDLPKHDAGEDFEILSEIRYARDTAIKAWIRPQAWVHDNAMEVDPEGESEWRLDADELDPDAWDNDYLLGSRHAPDWVRDWSGPFEIYLDFAFPDRPAVGVMVRNGYQVTPRGIFDRIAMPELVARARAFEGAYVLWDPMDGEQGFMLVGDDAETLAREAADHFEITA